VAQLTVQREQLNHAPDSLRAIMLVQMLASEAQARALQREARESINAARGSAPGPILCLNGQCDSSQARTRSQPADSGRIRALRARLQTAMDRHFAAEIPLRALEVADVERRLSQVRAETERRRHDRAELVRQMVDQILRDAERP